MIYWRMIGNGLPCYQKAGGDGWHCNEHMIEEREGRGMPRCAGREGGRSLSSAISASLARLLARSRVPSPPSPIPSRFPQSPVHLSSFPSSESAFPFSFLPFPRCDARLPRPFQPPPPHLAPRLARRNEINADEWFPSFPLTFASIIRDGSSDEGGGGS